MISESLVFGLLEILVFYHFLYFPYVCVIQWKKDILSDDNDDDDDNDVDNKVDHSTNESHKNGFGVII